MRSHGSGCRVGEVATVFVAVLLVGVGGAVFLIIAKVVLVG